MTLRSEDIQSAGKFEIKTATVKARFRTTKSWTLTANGIFYNARRSLARRTQKFAGRNKNAQFCNGWGLFKLLELNSLYIPLYDKGLNTGDVNIKDNKQDHSNEFQLYNWLEPVFTGTLKPLKQNVNSVEKSRSNENSKSDLVRMMQWLMLSMNMPKPEWALLNGNSSGYWGFVLIPTLLEK